MRPMQTTIYFKERCKGRDGKEIERQDIQAGYITTIRKPVFSLLPQVSPYINATITRKDQENPCEAFFGRLGTDRKPGKSGVRSIGNRFARGKGYQAFC